jgi:hypothetical protein
MVFTSLNLLEFQEFMKTLAPWYKLENYFFLLVPGIASLLLNLWSLRKPIDNGPVLHLRC